MVREDITCRYLTQISLNVLIPVDEHFVVKVQEEVSKMTGIDVYGIEFKYSPPDDFKPSKCEKKEIPNAR